MLKNWNMSLGGGFKNRELIEDTIIMQIVNKPSRDIQKLLKPVSVSPFPEDSPRKQFLTGPCGPLLFGKKP